MDCRFEFGGTDVPEVQEETERLNDDNGLNYSRKSPENRNTSGQAYVRITFKRICENFIAVFKPSQEKSLQFGQIGISLQF